MLEILWAVLILAGLGLILGLGLAIASKTLLGTVVGPGIINNMSSIGNIPPNIYFIINVYLKYNKIVLIYLYIVYLLLLNLLCYCICI